MHDTEQELRRRLAALPAGKRAALAERLADSTGRRLVAYVTGRRPADPVGGEALREFARDKLPDYMVPQAVVVLDEMPRTPGGKVDRRALRRAALRTRVTEEQNGFVAPRNPTERLLAQIWGDVLGVEAVGVHDDFFEVGGDSLLSIRILARANQQGVRISPEKFFAHPTVAQQAALADADDAARAVAGPVSGPAPLTPIQYWFFQRTPVDPQHWNQSVLLRVAETVDYPALEQALRQLLLRHDALRLRFSRDGDGWRQEVIDLGQDFAAPLCRVELADSGDERSALAGAAADLNQDFDLGKPPLLRAALLSGAGRPERLLIVIHHLVTDAVSWGILLADLETLYRQLQHGKTPQLPAATTAFKTWAEWLAGHARSDRVSGQTPYWARLLTLPAGDFTVPVDFPVDPDANRLAAARRYSVQLDADRTRQLLHGLPKTAGVQTDAVLIAALAVALGEWGGRRSLVIDLEGHGREALSDDVDVSRTVGWFATVFPLMLQLPDPAGGVVRVLTAVKEQLRALPERGIGYGLLREFTPDASAARLRAAPAPQVCFNYLGRLDKLFDTSAWLRIEDGDYGPSRSPRGLRAYLLNVDCRVVGGRLRVDWTYSEKLHRRDTIERLAENYSGALDSFLAAVCPAEAGAGGHTPADFPLADLEQDELAGLSRLLDDVDSTGDDVGRAD